MAQLSTLLQLVNDAGISGMAVYVDHTRAVATGKRKLKEAFGSYAVAVGRQQEIDRVSGGIHGPIQIGPSARDSNVRFIDPPRLVRAAHLSANALLEDGAECRTQRAMVE